jgi:hypothetical protein
VASRAILTQVQKLLEGCECNADIRAFGGVHRVTGRGPINRRWARSCGLGMVSIGSQGEDKGHRARTSHRPYYGRRADSRTSGAGR